MNLHPEWRRTPTPRQESEDDTAAERDSELVRELKSFYGAERLEPARPLFDVTLLGLGSDGHTASLFPGTAVLAERDQWAAAVVGPKSEARVTLTYPALESTRHAAFLVAGKEKHAVFERLRCGDDNLPATRLHPMGTLCLFVDAAAGKPITS